MSFHGQPAQNRTGRTTRVVRAVISPTTFDIHRAAAWWAGEGSVSSANGHLSVTIAQKEISVLEWMKDRFGGSIYVRKDKSKPHLDPVGAWAVSGPRARGFLLTVYSCIPESPRRMEQIYKALISTSKIKKRGPQPKSICGKGHYKDIDEECRVCANEARRIRRRDTPEGDNHRRKEYERYWRNPEKARAAARKYSEKKRRERHE